MARRSYAKTQKLRQVGSPHQGAEQGAGLGASLVAAGVGRRDTKSGSWNIYDATNAIFHEPWTYAVTLSPDKLYVGVWVAMKARRSAEERAALPSDVEIWREDSLTVPGLAAERCLVWMRPSQA